MQLKFAESKQFVQYLTHFNGYLCAKMLGGAKANKIVLCRRKETNEQFGNCTSVYRSNYKAN